jgi:myo-inositol-1(or 4)-monophosphatase
MADFRVDALKARFLAAQAVAREAGLLGKHFLASPESLEVSLKGPQDFVSAADRALEKLIAARFKEAFPEDAFLGEESSGEAPLADAAMRWVVDPIDGTANFVRNGSEWCVSIGLLEFGRPVIGVIYHPPSDRLYAARQGWGATRDGIAISVSDRSSLEGAVVEIDRSANAPVQAHLRQIRSILERGGEYRRRSCCTLSLTEVAEGRLDGFVEMRLNAWDVAAAIVLVREAGGWTNDFFEGWEMPEKRTLIAAAPGIKSELLAVLGFEESGARL